MVTEFITKCPKGDRPQEQGHVFAAIEGTYLLHPQKQPPTQKQNKTEKTALCSGIWHWLSPPEVWQARGVIRARGNSVTGTVQLEKHQQTAKTKSPLWEA